MLTVVSGCSSSKKAETPPTTTTTVSTVPASTTTEPASTTSTSAPQTTTTATGSTVTTAAGGTEPRITGFTITPASPVQCNAPTSIELKWTSTGATSVALSIDGILFAGYGGGAQDHLEPLACDGKSHTYLLTALGHGQNASAAMVVVADRVA